MADEKIHTIALRCQIQLEVTRRRYAPREQERLLDLFGQPDRWSQTLRSLLWTHANLVVPGFAGASTMVDLQVPCTFDFNVAATKYFEALTDGEIPLLMLFSGTVFYAPPDSPLQVAPISWEQEARYKLPVKLWREMMESYLPQLRMDQSAPRYLRPSLPLQDATRHSHLGTSSGACAFERRGVEP